MEKFNSNEKIEDSGKLSQEIINLCLTPEEVKFQKEESIKKITGFLDEVDTEKFFKGEQVQGGGWSPRNLSYQEQLNKKFDVGVFSFSAFDIMVDNIQHRLGYSSENKQLVDYIVGYAEKIGKKDLKFDNKMAYDELLMKLQTVSINDDLAKKINKFLSKNSESEGDEQYSAWDDNLSEVGSDIGNLKWA